MGLTAQSGSFLTAAMTVWKYRENSNLSLSSATLFDMKHLDFFYTKYYFCIMRKKKCNEKIKLLFNGNLNISNLSQNWESGSGFL